MALLQAKCAAVCPPAKHAVRPRNPRSDSQGQAVSPLPPQARPPRRRTRGPGPGPGSDAVRSPPGGCGARGREPPPRRPPGPRPPRPRRPAPRTSGSPGPGLKPDAPPAPDTRRLQCGPSPSPGRTQNIFKSCKLKPGSAPAAPPKLQQGRAAPGRLRPSAAPGSPRLSGAVQGGPRRPGLPPRGEAALTSLMMPQRRRSGPAAQHAEHRSRVAPPPAGLGS